MRYEVEPTPADLVEAVAKAILGPRNPVPTNSVFTLEHLREHIWKNAAEHERRDAMWAAISAISEMQSRMEAASSEETVTVPRMPYREALDAYDAIATRYNYADAHMTILRQMGIVVGA